MGTSRVGLAAIVLFLPLLLWLLMQYVYSATNTVMALPETGLGLVPSAGITYHLGRMQNGVRCLGCGRVVVVDASLPCAVFGEPSLQVGMYLGLSGATLRGEQVYWAGVTDLFSTPGAQMSRFPVVLPVFVWAVLSSRLVSGCPCVETVVFAPLFSEVLGQEVLEHAGDIHSYPFTPLVLEEDPLYKRNLSLLRELRGDEKYRLFTTSGAEDSLSKDDFDEYFNMKVRGCVRACGMDAVLLLVF